MQSILIYTIKNKQALEEIIETLFKLRNKFVNKVT